MINLDYIFEINREVCNKINGIHKALLIKAGEMQKIYGDKYILISPDKLGNELENPEFAEDKNLCADQIQKAEKDGIRVRAGRWNIKGKPLVLLVDFSNLINKKDEIFKSLWEKYNLDSLSGQWSYIEKALFGYASGKLIESFCKSNLVNDAKIVANFHDRNTATGLLYLNYYMPKIATIFTVNSTIVGKTLIQNGLFELKNIKNTDTNEIVRNYGIVSKQSLEKITAATADIVVTSSNFMKEQISVFLDKKADFIIPDSFPADRILTGTDYQNKRETSRKKLIEVVQNLTNTPVKKDTKLIYTCGKYSTHNDSIKMLISSAVKMRNNKNINKDIILFILTPTNIYGKREDLYNKISENTGIELQEKITTHVIHEQEFDPLLNTIKENGFENNPDDKVKIIYSPVFLDGNDGIYNIDYNDILYGFDNAVFTSYHGEWGYVAVEAMAAGNPVIMSNLSGFANRIEEQKLTNKKCIKISENKDIDNAVNNTFAECVKRTEKEISEMKDTARDIVKNIDTKKIIPVYEEIIKTGFKKVEGIKDTAALIPKNKFKEVKSYKSNKPIWRSLSVKPQYPANLKGLDEISKNIWWAWNYNAGELFGYIAGKNLKCNDPIAILKKTSYEKFSKLENDKKFLNLYNKVYSDFKKYMSESYNESLPEIAYFSMEYGLANILKIYSGGLGVLAGDYLKQASDSCFNMSAVGLFYRQGYFTQHITGNGEQNAIYENQIFNELPAELIKDETGNAITVEIAYPGRIVHIQIWKVAVGRINLYLLDTDRENNREDDRKITHRLYGGDNEHRLKQEILLGVGGIRALNKLGIKKDVYHCNEGHAAFISIERMSNLTTTGKFTFAEAQEIIRASSLFTTHTPVPAGHDAFPGELIMAYMGHIPKRLNIGRKEFLNLGKQRSDDPHDLFSMSVLATNFSQEINGVSKLHGEVSRNRIFNNLWEGYFPEELHIGYVTNGIHYSTWTSKLWQKLLMNKNNEPDFNKIYSIPDKKIWKTKQKDKQKLIKFIKKRIESVRVRRNESPRTVLKIKSTLSENALTIGFARRFATYKRGDLLFSDLERLSKIVNNPEMPVQFIFAGKAHPHDKGGQAIIKKITEISKREEFIGKIIFLENYNMALAKELVQGVDIWLNTPTRPLEASGTSGMKAVMNGAMNFSVLDGWWVEGYKKDAGWALPEKRTYENQQMQNDLDAEMIYRTFENEIIPLYYKRNQDNLPIEWISNIKKCIVEIAPEFTTKRMINDYQERFYSKLSKRSAKLEADNYSLAREIAGWKKKVSVEWDKIEVVNLTISEPVKDPVIPGEKYYGELILDIKNLKADDVGAEIITTETNKQGEQKILNIEALKFVKQENGKAYFSIVILPSKPGAFDYAFRIFAKNKNLPHRQDFHKVKWV